jgi:hypothetical protein
MGNLSIHYRFGKIRFFSLILAYFFAEHILYTQPWSHDLLNAK